MIRHLKPYTDAFMELKLKEDNQNQNSSLIISNSFVMPKDNNN